MKLNWFVRVCNFYPGGNFISLYSMGCLLQRHFFCGMSKGETHYSSLERVQVSPPFVHAYNELPAFVGGSHGLSLGVL